MIAFLKGQLYSKGESGITIDCGGVGYGVQVSRSTLDTLPKAGEAVFLEIYHHISENEQRLFGFSTKEEKALFELIITVKGIGPRLGLAVLSGLPPTQLSSAIASGDVLMLSSISGIGKKTAERIVLELRDKVQAIGLDGGSISDSPQASGEASSTVNKAIAAEAIAALESLGYKRPQAMKAVQEAIANNLEEIKGSQNLIKKALIYLNN